jgi:predicted RNase H-like HicB family nuclease
MRKVKRQVYQYTAVFEPDPEKGGYTAYIPSLPGCISEGDTFEQALQNIKEAASLWLEVMTTGKERSASRGDGVIVAPIQVAV